MIYDEWLATPGVRELVPVLSRVDAGQEPMTRALLLEVTDTLSPYYFGHAIEFNRWYSSEDPEIRKEEDEQEMRRQWRHQEMVEAWSEAWIKIASPEWIDLFIDILVNPPSKWTPDEGFSRLFFVVVTRSPEESVKLLAKVLGDEKNHLVVTQVFSAFQEYLDV
jgi:hypothetical protein